jgi:hypothetical protein
LALPPPTPKPVDAEVSEKPVDVGGEGLGDAGVEKRVPPPEAPEAVVKEAAGMKFVGFCASGYFSHFNAGFVFFGPLAKPAEDKEEGEEERMKELGRWAGVM